MDKGTSRVSIDDARNQLRELERITGQSARRCDEVLGRFALFAERAFKVTELTHIDADCIEQFVKAKIKGALPSTATMHMRRSVLRLMFRVAHESFGFSDDPTRFLELPPRTMSSARPLTDDEVALGRSYSMHTLTATRQPAAWALGEATATTAELPHITVDDLDLVNARVWLHGSRKRAARWGQLGQWGVTQLDRRVSSLTNTKHLIYRGAGSEESQQASCCTALKETLIRAGLDAEPDVRPASLAAWAGTAVLAESGRIEVVARRLGIRSLDAAAQFINFNWSE